MRMSPGARQRAVVALLPVTLANHHWRTFLPLYAQRVPSPTRTYPADVEKAMAAARAAAVAEALAIVEEVENQCE